MANNPPARIFVILARDTPVGVIFRKGPSKQVLLIKWNRSNDRFEYGQWFKGRIYERHCDLSPSGDKLIYSAAKWKGPLKAWTAISKPPFLTALALWPNSGWPGRGGAVFESENTIAGINAKRKLADGFNLPPNITLKPLGSYNSIYMECLLRDGWACLGGLIEKLKFVEADSNGGTILNDLIKKGVLEEVSAAMVRLKGNERQSIRRPSEIKSNHFDGIWGILKESLIMGKVIGRDSPVIYYKVQKGFALQMKLKGSFEQVEYNMETRSGKNSLDFGRLDWADWDKNGDLLFSKGGKLFRLRRKKDAYTIENAVELADFNGLNFEEKVAPKEALTW